jgi:hypothetical protein
VWSYEPFIVPRHHRQVNWRSKLFWPANHLNSVFLLISLDCVSSLSISSLNFSSLCVRRCGLLQMLLLCGNEVHWDSLYRLLPHTGPPWMRLGCTGPPWFSWDGIQKRYEEARWSTCAGLQLSSLTSYRRAEKPKMVSTSSSSPICGLRPRIRGWSLISPRPASGSSLQVVE